MTSWYCQQKRKSGTYNKIATLGNFVEIFQEKDGIIRFKDGQIWIPEEKNEVKLRITAHIGASGRRGGSTTEKVLLEHFKWDTVSKDIQAVF